MTAKQADPLVFLSFLVWLDGERLSIEPYRQKIFRDFLYTFEADGRLRYTLALLLRGKKNNKSLDGVLASLYTLLFRKCLGGTTCLSVCFDEDQAAQNLDLAKKIIKVNPVLADRVTIKQKSIERRDGDGIYEIRPGRDFQGQHGGKFDFLDVDEIHTQRDYNLLEALAPDPTRESQTWITSYNSILHKPGIPLYDLLKTAWEGTDPSMYFSYYAADRTTDPETPEERANPSMASWNNKNYLQEQARRLPSHRYRRLHLNLPGAPEGAAFSAEKIMDAIDRGVTSRAYMRGVEYHAFVDMSGGSRDDSCVAVAHLEGEEEKACAVLDRVVNQGPPCPFDPRRAVKKFAKILKDYGIFSVTGDKYAGETFIMDFEREGISYYVSDLNKSEIYEALEPRMNAGRVVLLDNTKMESQFLGLIWRGNKIDHPNDEHDDYANAAAGAIQKAFEDTQSASFDDISVGGRPLATANLEHAGLGASRRSDGPWADDDRDFEVDGEGNDDSLESIFEGLDDYGDW